MSTEAESNDMKSTKPLPEHAWLQQLVGTWKSENEMMMGSDGEVGHSLGTEHVVSLGGLWAYFTGEGEMPDGSTMTYHSGLGYDVSFREYRGFWIASMSSHLWTYRGKLSEDGKTMTLDCVGPHMEKDGETANYRDVIEIIDVDHRTLTSFGQQEDGEWVLFMKATLTRV